MGIRTPPHPASPYLKQVVLASPHPVGRPTFRISLLAVRLYPLPFRIIPGVRAEPITIGASLVTRPLFGSRVKLAIVAFKPPLVSMARFNRLSIDITSTSNVTVSAIVNIPCPTTKTFFL